MDGAVTAARAHGDAYEESVSRLYLASVRLGRPTREALRGEGFEEAVIADVTAELVARAMLLPGADGDSWEVVPPNEAIARHTERAERRLALSRATATEVDLIWRKAMGEGRVMEPPGMDLLTSVEDIGDRMRGLARAATDRLWWAMDASAASLAVIAATVLNPERLRVREGVDVRLMVDIALLEEDTMLPFLDVVEDMGHPVRVGNGIPFSLLLCDSRAAVLDLSRHDPRGDGSLEARRSGPLHAVAALLDQVWMLSTPLALTPHAVGAGPGGEVPLAERDQRILGLLTTGASDQLIARQLGVSVRTVERRVRYLLAHLGAATRFQAGVQAVLRGWV